MAKITHYPHYPGMTENEFSVVKRALQMYVRHCHDCENARLNRPHQLAIEGIASKRKDAETLLNRWRTVPFSTCPPS